jgi:hypothetical protein
MANPLELLETLRQLMLTAPRAAPTMYSQISGQGGPAPDAPARPLAAPTDVTASVDVTAPQPLPLPPPSPPGAPRRSATVTPGIAASAPAQAPQEALPTPPEPLSQIQAMRAGEAQAPAQEEGGRDLANFGFGMAASRNPSLFGQIGEAGLAMMRGRREDRQDTNSERQLSVTEAFQQARIRLQEAEQRYQEDPSNPANIARLAQARYYEAQAARALRGGGEGGGGDGDGRVVAREVGNDGNIYNVFRDGSVRPALLPDGTPFQRGGNPDQMDQRILTARQRATQELAIDPTFSTQPPARQAAAISERTQVILRDMQGANTVRQGRAGAPAPDVAAGVVPPPATPRIRVDMNGRIIN